jgi:aryl-alcohol dehydrogenase-like predicted oxidoreductase
MGYSVLALGLLSGRVNADRTFGGDDQRKDDPRYSPESRARVARLMDKVSPIAAAHDATPAQVVIAWTLAQPGLTFALCGARNPAQARENAGAGRMRLEADEVSAISDALATHIDPSPT